MFRIVFASLIAALSFTPAFADDHCKPRTHTASPDQVDIVKTAATAGSFKTLVSLLVAADLADTLKSEGPFTVFAPSDEAFAKLPKGTLDTLLKPENKKALVSILTYHVIPGKGSFQFQNAYAGQTAKYKTVNGKEVNLKVTDDAIKINDSKITVKNIRCTNGSIQVIDSVLLPPDGKANTIPEIAANAGTFKTLLTALKAAELADVLGGEGPFTVFAPTDDAFAKLPEGTIKKLLKPESRDQLVAILKYHVVAGKKSMRDIVGASSIETLQSGKVATSIVDGGVRLNDSKVIKSDIAASNGIIHVIDAVLIPKK